MNETLESAASASSDTAEADETNPATGPSAAPGSAETAEADATTATDAATDVAAPSDPLLIEADQKLVLTVEGGEFAEVRLTDSDHSTVPVDTGSFNAGTDTTDSSDSTGASSSDATGGPAETDTAETDTAVTDPAEPTAEAQAGGTTDPTHSLVDADSDDEEAGTQDSDSDESSVDGATGSTDPQGDTWESAVNLVTGASYEWEATTISPDGAEHTATGTITTPDTTAQEELTAKTVIADDQTVGVGAPIVVMFNSTIPDDSRAAIEARLSVEVTDEDGEPVDVEGSWGWLYDTDGISRVHYRPQEFWPANVNIDVNLPLEGVEYSPRWYGKEDVSLSFEVGRDQRVVADAASHRMTIERDGEEIADWPTSLGSAKAPSYNGTHVVMSKHEFYTMTSERWNYETDVSWAVRIHNNGEFIHAAPWSVGVQGSANVSHGCINLSTERAKEYFDMALYGDPVEITGSSVELTTEHSDISDWVYSWDDWQELSALS